MKGYTPVKFLLWTLPTLFFILAFVFPLEPTGHYTWLCSGIYRTKELNQELLHGKHVLWVKFPWTLFWNIAHKNLWNNGKNTLQVYSSKIYKINWLLFFLNYKWLFKGITVWVFVVVLGPHLAELRFYSWFCTQGSLLAGSENHMEYWGLNTD